MAVNRAQKETPGPLNRKRSRKGSWGQRRQLELADEASQTFGVQIRKNLEGLGYGK